MTIRFDRVFFTNNYCLHVGGVEGAGNASVILDGSAGVVMGNQVKALSLAQPSMNLGGMPGTVVGNITWNGIVNHPNFPNPEASLLSRLADEKNTNNLTGFKNQRADQIIAEYAQAFDIPTRVRLMQELDGIFTNDQQWIMEWTAPYQRFVYWNKFGTPKGYITRIGDHRDIASLWWNDPVKAQALAEAQRDSSKQLGEGPSDDKYWLEFAKTQAEPNP